MAEQKSSKTKDSKIKDPVVKGLSMRNFTRRPGRTAALIILSIFLSFAILAGSLVVNGLKGGLESLESRLGADVMVVPYEAATKSELDDMILQGNMGYFYMDDSVVDEIRQLDGVGEVTVQFYLATASASCCSSSVQIIGYDPDTDFVVSPWIKSTTDEGDLGYMEVYVGNTLNAFAGDVLTFYGQDVTVKGRLDETGTFMDTAVYATEETIKALLQSAEDLGFNMLYDADPDDVVSCVMVNVAEGYVVEDVLNEINLYVDNVEAEQTSEMIDDIASKLTGIAGVSQILIVVVWVLALVILVLAYTMITNERKKEFAVLRVIGASRRKLAGILLKETLLISAIGSVIGAAAAFAVAKLFANQIESTLELPFLIPSGLSLVLLIVLAIVISIAAGSISSAVCAFRISRVDTSLILRGDN